jgi:hypothetical protein
MPPHFLYIFAFANLPDQLSHSSLKVTRQNGFAVFGDLNKVAFQIVKSVARLREIFHAASILNSSLKIEGFLSFPKWDNNA